MQLIYTLIEENIPSDCYIIKIKYEHGDADNTYEEIKLQSISELGAFIKYVKRFNEVSDTRDFTKDLNTEMKFLGFNFPFRYGYCDGSKINAAMSIDSIQYFDEYSNKFKVVVKV